MKIVSRIEISEKGILLNGVSIECPDLELNTMYRTLIGNYPKFFKMDSLCKLGFIGAELLLKDLSAEEKNNAAVILFNRSGSLVTDRNYQQTIASDDNYFPSPALFVYTLANIVTGEIAIRHKIYGESSFYILDKEDDAEMESIVENTFLTSNPSFILTGWVEYENCGHFKANMKLITNE